MVALNQVGDGGAMVLERGSDPSWEPLPKLPATMLAALLQCGGAPFVGRLHPEQGESEVFLGNVDKDLFRAAGGSAAAMNWKTGRLGNWAYGADGVLLNSGLRPYFAKLSELREAGVDVLGLN